jgi:hypothetical protein
MDREREPRLEFHVHQAKFSIHEVEVDDQADAPVRAHFGSAVVVPHAEGAAGFHRAVDAYQALRDAVSSGQLASILLHPLGASQVKVGAACLLRQGVSVRLERLGKPRGCILEVPPSLLGLLQIEGNLVPTQPAEKVADAGYGQMPTEDHAVKAFQNTIDSRAVLGDKRVHGVVPRCWYG